MLQTEREKNETARKKQVISISHLGSLLEKT